MNFIRGVEKQVSYDNGGAVGTAHFRFFGDVSAFQHETGAAEAAGSLGHQLDAADGSNGGQRFATKTHGTDGSQIFFRTELGSGVTLEGGTGILGRHTAAIVGDPQESHAAVPDFNGDLGGTGVHGVFQQFLHHRGRPLHHLTGGNQISNMGG